MADRLVLIDFASIARPIYEAAGNSPNVDQVSIDIVARIRALTSDDKHAALCLDSGRSFRKDISPDYKAQRPETPQAYLHQCGLALDVLRGDGYPVWQADGFEADDLLASAVERAIETNIQAAQDERNDILIITGDKDMHQLIGPRVSVLRPANGKNPHIVYDADNFEVQHAGLSPHQIVDYLALVGDASDNVKGADGIGPKTAAKLLSTYGNLDDLYAAMDKGQSFTPAVQKALLEFYPRLAEVRSLLTLRTDVPLPFEEILTPRALVEDIEIATGETPREGFKMHDDIEEAMPTIAPPAATIIPSTPAAVVPDNPVTAHSTVPSVPNGAASGHSTPGLASALARAQGAIQHADKDSNNPFFGSKYADLASVWSACRKPLSDNGLSVVQLPETVFIGQPVFEVKQTQKGERLTVKVITRVKVTTRLMHASGESLDNVIETLLPNGDPQSIGSAITYLRRYSLSSIVGVAPDDDDGEAAMRITPNDNQRYAARVDAAQRAK